MIKDGIEQITPKQLKSEYDAGGSIFLLDVREPHEVQIATLGGYLIPQNDVEKRLSELDRNDDIVVLCRSGVRSQKIALVLRQNGFQKVRNLAGGILAWSDEIDPTVKKY